MHTKALAAEVFGTFWLVLGGCGAAVLAADFGTGGNGTSLGLGFLGVSFAFGFTVLTAAYAVGHVSGGHFNPAVTFGLCNVTGSCCGDLWRRRNPSVGAAVAVLGGANRRGRSRCTHLPKSARRRRHRRGVN